MKTLKGVLTFHSETGTEGGYWAFQDEKYIGIRSPQTDNAARCTRCGIIRDLRESEPSPTFTYWYNDYSENGIDYIGGYRSSNEPRDDCDLPPDSDYISSSNELSLQCLQEGHENWELLYPNGTWSYEGLHILKDGDYLKIFFPENSENHGQIAWEGVINFNQYDLFTEHAKGLWIHSDQLGVDRSAWASMFLSEWPAELVPSA